MPRNFVDFAELKEQVSIEEVVDMLELRLKPSGNQLRGGCPVCDPDGRSLVVTPAKGVYYCFANKKGGDLIALAAHVLDTSVKEAAIQIAEQYGVTGTSRDSTGNGTSSSHEPQETRGKGGDRTLQPLGYLESDHDAVLAVGFDPKDAEVIGIGYAPKGIMRGYVAIPIRLPDGKLLGYIGVHEAKLPPGFHLNDDDNVVRFPKKRA